MTTLLGLCGSLRAASTNRKLMLEAARHFAADTFTDGDLRLPLYDGDLEDRGMPDPVQTLSDQVASADAVVIACPEYNKGPSGVLKNALDWISRTKGSPWRDKPVALVSAAAGRGGGDRAQFALRLMMVPFRARVLPGPEVLIADSGNAFDAEGRLISDRYDKGLADLMAQLRAMT